MVNGVELIKINVKLKVIFLYKFFFINISYLFIKYLYVRIIK